MNNLVNLTTQDGVAVITINNPPVNALSPGVPEGLLAALDVAEEDPLVRAIVIIGGGRTFIAGADIKELEPASLKACWPLWMWPKKIPWSVPS
jgi:3-hydroxyacyl-CoA dehydrogenase